MPIRVTSGGLLSVCPANGSVRPVAGCPAGNLWLPLAADPQYVHEDCLNRLLVSSTQVAGLHEQSRRGQKAVLVTLLFLLMSRPVVRKLTGLS